MRKHWFLFATKNLLLLKHIELSVMRFLIGAEGRI